MTFELLHSGTIPRRPLRRLASALFIATFSAVAFMMKHHDASRRRLALEALPDRILRDIGLPRDVIADRGSRS